MMIPFKSFFNSYQNRPQFFNPKFSQQNSNKPELKYDKQYTQKQSQPIRYNDELYQISDPPTRKQILGEAIYNDIMPNYKENTGKITGMMLEMPDSEIIQLLKDKSLVIAKANEALAVLKEHFNKV